MNAKRLVNTKGMDTLTWLKYRRMGICSSDTSIILGQNNYKSVLELWKDKTGQIPVEEKENKFTHWGHILEKVVREEFQRVTGKKVQVRNAIYQSKEFDFLLANIDGLVYEPDGSKALFEAKTAVQYKNQIWRDGEIPEAYYSQIQHAMYVCGLKRAYIACLVGGHEFYWYAVDYDPQYCEWLIEKEQTFWNHVLDMTVPEVDGSEATSKYLSQEYKDTRFEEIALPDEAGSIAEQYLLLDENIKDLQQEKELLGNQLKMMLKEHEKGVAGVHRVSWKSAQRTSLDTVKLKEDLGDRYYNYTKKTSYRTLSVA